MKFFLRTFLGVQDFLEGETVKTLLEIWFKQLNWMVLSGALIAAGIKLESTVVGYPLLFLGVLSTFFVLLYSRHSTNEMVTALFTDIERINKRNKKYDLKEYSKNTAKITALVIMWIMSVGEMLIMIFALTIFL